MKERQNRTVPIPKEVPDRKRPQEIPERTPQQERFPRPDEIPDRVPLPVRFPDGPPIKRPGTPGDEPS